MTRTTDSLFDELHGLVAESYRNELKRFKDEGEGIPPALLTSIVKFLKDNGIDRPAQTADDLDLLNDELPENITPLHKAV